MRAKDPEERIRAFERCLKAIGFTRRVMEQLLPSPMLFKLEYKEEVGRKPMLLSDDSPEGYYHTVVVPHYHAGKVLFMIDLAELESLLKSLKGEKH